MANMALGWFSLKRGDGRRRKVVMKILMLEGGKFTGWNGIMALA